MGKVVVSQFISTDGVIEAPGGGEGFEHAGWAFRFSRGDDGDRLKFEELLTADALLLGRVGYQEFAAVWPSMPGTGEFGEKMNGMPKYVVSSTLADDQAEWTNSTVIRGDVAAGVRELKDRLEGDILVSAGAGLVRTLAEHDLVDEYRLMVFPVVLGSGKRLFGDGFPYTSLRVLGSTPVGPDGVYLLTQEPVRS